MENRTIQYYKTLKPIQMNDGFEIKEGTKVLFNFSEGQIYNVQIESAHEKRIFWVHSLDLKLFKTVKEKWLKKDIEKYNIDLNDKWFEFDKQKKVKKNIKNVKIKKITTGNKSSTRTTPVGKIKSTPKKRNTTSKGRTINKTRVSTTKRKTITKKTRKSK